MKSGLLVEQKSMRVAVAAFVRVLELALMQEEVTIAADSRDSSASAWLSGSG